MTEVKKEEKVVKMVVGGPTVSEAAADRLGFSTVPRGWSKQRKYPVSGGHMEENALSMSEVKGQNGQ